METTNHYEPALNPDDLARFFVARANDGDVEGLVALYEADATLATAAGQVARGSDEIRRFYSLMLSQRPKFTYGEQNPALQNGELALTSTRLKNGAVTAEIARQQPDGAWLWAVDQPNIAAVAGRT